MESGAPPSHTGEIEMRNRFNNAVDVQEGGACNPSGILHSMLEACEEIRNSDEYWGTDDIRQDPAIRLMAHQLGYLLALNEIDHGSTDVYSDLMHICRSKQIAR